MPSWVLPAVAAELWGVSVEQVLADIADGRAASHVQGEFVFVDADPCSEAGESAPRLAYRRSLAWTPAQVEPHVTPAERDALLDDADADADYGMEQGDAEDGPPGDAPAPMALTEDDAPEWEPVRARVSRTRRPPSIRAAA